jgi:hypothetical protein
VVLDVGPLDLTTGAEVVLELLPGGLVGEVSDEEGGVLLTLASLAILADEDGASVDGAEGRARAYGGLRGLVEVRGG